MKTIVIFDDDENIVDVCKFILEQQGFRVIGFNDNYDIVDKLNGVNADIVLMDNSIAGMGGIKATQLIKTTPELSDIKVVYFSANSDIKQLAQEANADYYLEKPFNIEQLEDLVNKILLSTKIQEP